MQGTLTASVVKCREQVLFPLLSLLLGTCCSLRTRVDHLFQEGAIDVFLALEQNICTGFWGRGLQEEEEEEAEGWMAAFQSQDKRWKVPA